MLTTLFGRLRVALQKPRTGRTGYSLKTRLYTIIGFLGLLPVLGVIFAFVTMANATRDNVALDRAARGTIHLERINGLVYAVVMESRGIYMSADPLNPPPALCLTDDPIFSALMPVLLHH